MYFLVSVAASLASYLFLIRIYVPLTANNCRPKLPDFGKDLSNPSQKSQILPGAKFGRRKDLEFLGRI